MQKLISKLFSTIVIIFWGLSLNAQNLSPLLEKADSLFEKKRFTQSIKLYDSLLSQGQYSPAMLLKMSFISEGLEKYSESLYYLNLYYLSTTDEDALVKMEELGTNNELVGYKANDKDVIFTYFYRYFSIIIFCLLAISLILIVTAFYIKLKTKKTPYWAAIGFVVISGFIFYLVNYGRTYDRGILTAPASYLMSDASSGSTLIAVAGEGHKVEILDKNDVWVKILWNDTPLYVKENHIKTIKLF